MQARFPFIQQAMAQGQAILNEAWQKSKQAARFIWRNPIKILVGGTVLLSVRKVNRWNATASSVEDFPDVDGVCPVSYGTYSMLLRDMCPTGLTSQQVYSVIEHKSEILSEAQKQTEVERVHQSVMMTAQDFQSAQKTLRTINSENFRIAVVDGFPQVGNNPGALGHFSASKNLLEVRSPSQLKCDDFSYTIQSGLTAAHTAAWRRATSQTDVPSHELDYPFTTEAEEKKLMATISQDTQLITQDFANLHQKARTGKLSAAEQGEYNAKVAALKDYQPRCRMLFIRSALKDVKAHILSQGDSLLYDGQRLYVTSAEEYHGGTIVHGRFVADPTAEKEKATAFIADVSYDTVQARKRIYSTTTGRPEDSRILERQVAAGLYSDINTNPPQVISTFYKNVDQYNQAFFARREEVPEKEIQQKNTGVKPGK